jgi:hypothetical protein
MLSPSLYRRNNSPGIRAFSGQHACDDSSAGPDG